ncbi:Unknown protein, partial [Striga hermonthica]
ELLSKGLHDFEVENCGTAMRIEEVPAVRDVAGEEHQGEGVGVKMYMSNYPFDDTDQDCWESCRINGVCSLPESRSKMVEPLRITSLMDHDLCFCIFFK